MLCMSTCNVFIIFVFKWSNNCNLSISVLISNMVSFKNITHRNWSSWEFSVIFNTHTHTHNYTLHAITIPIKIDNEFSSEAQSCPTLWDPMNCSTPGLPVHHQLPEFTQTHVHRVGDTIQPAHPLSSPSPPAPNPSQHQSLFQWVNSSHEVAKVLEFQL